MRRGVLAPRALAAALVALSLVACAIPRRPMGPVEQRRALRNQRVVGKVGLATGIVLSAVASLATYETVHLCDDYPDPADDCGVGKGLSAVLTALVWAAAVGATVPAAVLWYSSEKELEALDQSLAESLRRARKGQVRRQR